MILSHAVEVVAKEFVVDDLCSGEGVDDHAIIWAGEVERSWGLSRIGTAFGF
jgi:hypothetical protein